MNYYKHSGDITMGGLLNGMATGVVVALVLSIPFAYINVYIPFVYLTILATVGYAGVTGWLSAKVARAGDLQSVGMYILIGLVSGIAAEYFNWVAWIFAVSRQQALIFNPVGLVAAARQILPEGTWGLRGNEAVSGIPLLCIWIIEAGMIIGIATYITYRGLVQFICCPECKKWFDRPTKTVHFKMSDKPELVTFHLRSLQFKSLTDLGKADLAVDRRYFAVELYFCPACSKFGCFTVKSVETVIKKDKAETKEKVLINRLILPMDRLVELAA
jgi:hypothetical protein